MRSRPLALVTVLLATACGAGAPGSGSGSVAGRTYLSVSSTRPLAAGTQILLEFDGDRIMASADCNLISGPVQIERDRIVVDEIAVTAMGCDQARAEQDSWLADLLQSDPRYVVDGDRLRLRSGGTTVEFLDREAADPDRPLTGTEWRLETIADADVAGSVPQGAAATVRFEGGRVSLRIHDCNSAEGQAEVDGDEIRIGPLMWTQRACHGAAAEVEQATRAVLHGTITHEIEATSLTLRNPDRKELGLRAA